MKTSLPKRVLFANPWWHQDIVNGTVRHAAEHGWHLDLQTCMSGELPDQWTGDGIITLLGGDLAKLQRFMKRSGCPAVSLNDNHPTVKIPRVCQDDATAGRMAADHFLRRGFSSYAFYSHGQSPQATSRRYEAFQARLEQAGQTAHPLLWGRERGRRKDTWLNRQAWLSRKLPALPKPLAVFALNDMAAAEVIEACLTDFIAVPDEVAVLGMLDMAVFRHSTTVPLSSITVDFDSITRAACDLLARLMNGAPPPDKPIHFEPTGIAVRRSTDTIAARDPEVARGIRFMLDHYADPIGSREIARATGVGKTILYEAFRRDLGQTPGAVLRRIRIDNARRMLRESNEKIHVIAEACGFGDRINLHRNFQKHLGTSPAAYRRQAREE